MLFVYPAIFHNEDNAYWVEFPDLPGCNTFADTIPEAVASAQEAMTGYLITILEQREAIPKATPITKITTDDESFSSLISCDLSEYNLFKSVKKTLTIPAWLNEKATAEKINFSQTLQDALISKIQA